MAEDLFPNTLAGEHLAWYFRTRAAGHATPAEIDAHFAPEYRWDWGSPRETEALEAWFARWRSLHATILKVEQLSPTRFVVTSRVGEGGAASVWFDLEEDPPHRIRQTSTSEARHAIEPGNIERDTAVERLDDGRARAAIHAAFTTPNGPFGGYLAAIAVRAAGAHASLPVPRSFACHFVGVGRSGAIDIKVDRLRTGRRLESLRVDVVQQDKLLLSGLVWAANEVSPPRPDTEPSVTRGAGTGNDSDPLFGGAMACAFEGGDAMASATTRFPAMTVDDAWLAAARLLLPFDLVAVQAVNRLPDGGGRQPQTLDTTIAFFNCEHRDDVVHCHAEAELGDDDVAVAKATLRAPDGRILGMASQQVLRRVLWG